MFGLADTSISREGNRHDMNYTELDFKILGLKWTNLPFLLLYVHTLDSIRITYVMKILHWQYCVNKGQIELRMYSYDAYCLITFCLRKHSSSVSPKPGFGIRNQN